MASSIVINRIQLLIWVAIYGGLLSIVLATFVGRNDEPVAWWMTAFGGVFVAVGVVLVYVRSRLKESA